MDLDRLEAEIRQYGKQGEELTIVINDWGEHLNRISVGCRVIFHVYVDKDSQVVEGLKQMVDRLSKEYKVSFYNRLK